MVSQTLEESTRARILEAAFTCVQRLGLGRTSMSDVARTADLSRQTLYRYFESKHDLIAALVIREEQRLLGMVGEAVAPHDDLRPALEAAFATSLRFFADHPLLSRIMASEPQELLPFLTVEGNPVIDLGTRTMEEVFGPLLPNASRVMVHSAAEACARVLTSYAITPPSEQIDVVAVSLAELVCHGLEKQR